MARSRLTLQEHRTTLAADEVLGRARAYFTPRSALYATFLDREGPGFCTFRGQGGEEIVIATRTVDGVTAVTGSSYLFDMQISRFFATLPEAPASAAMPAAGATEVAR